MKRLTTDRRAIAAIEFAIMLPMLAFMLLASVDLVTWLRSWFLAERTAMAVGDMVSRAHQYNSADFQSSGVYFTVANDSAQPLAVSGNGGATIVSCLAAGSGKKPQAQIGWQEKQTTNAAYVSKFGTAGSIPVLPVGFSLAPNETVIVAEIYSSVQPWILSAKIWPTPGGPPSGPTSIYTYALFRPRLAQLC